ncbi:hypothetical protein B0T10DRAFT_414348 [Thelonectria olida]|uniref:chitinase n=1 Tax=Thelonectria olida TaxID=1576542 RepID=A0A9P8VUJ5_9HYPO|nr:hypothetical protein B0T10DRAFT_414348 [Thelonectria olida]
MAASAHADENATCKTYIVQEGDSCWSIGQSWGLTADGINNFNVETWGWRGCHDLATDVKICLSPGKPPLPLPVNNAVCGPQKPGLSLGANAESISDLAKLNPCPLNACCNVWGQCGSSPEFCTPADSSTGNLGTWTPGKAGCISNCGTEIKSDTNNLTSRYHRVGYYDSSHWTRPCLNMNVASSNTRNYTHMHWASGSIGKNLSVYVEDKYGEWEGFMSLKGVKKIVSLGGSGYFANKTLNQRTNDILRHAMRPENRDRFVSNLVDFVETTGIDGIHFDWATPKAANIAQLVAGEDFDGALYLATLEALRESLQDKYSISISVPSQYWLLKAFPVSTIANVSGCPSGNCLRSHINQTEVEYALSLITKAGVSSSKVIVGEASFGRSFNMAKADCTGPDCSFTGTAFKSDATPGRCTNISGWISDGEIAELIREQGDKVTTWYDKETGSDYLVYNDLQWVSYASEHTKKVRREKWRHLHFLGTMDWTVDLQVGDGPSDATKQSSCTSLENSSDDETSQSPTSPMTTGYQQPTQESSVTEETSQPSLTLTDRTSFRSSLTTGGFSTFWNSSTTTTPASETQYSGTTGSSGASLTHQPSSVYTPGSTTSNIPSLSETPQTSGAATSTPATHNEATHDASAAPTTETSTDTDTGIGLTLPSLSLPTSGEIIPTILFPTGTKTDTGTGIGITLPSLSLPTTLPSTTETGVPEDCDSDDCTEGKDCEDDDCTQGGDCIGVNCKRGGRCKGPHCTRGGSCFGNSCENGGGCEGLGCIQGGGCFGLGCIRGGSCIGPSCHQGGTCSRSTPGDCTTGGCVGAQCVDDGSGEDCTSKMTAELCTETISSTAVQTSPTTSWSTTTRTACRTITECDVTGSTTTMTVTGTDEPDPTAAPDGVYDYDDDTSDGDTDFDSIEDDYEAWEKEADVTTRTKTTTSAKPRTTLSTSTVPRKTVTVTAEPSQTPTADCDFWDAALFWYVEISNIKGWSEDGGDSLKDEEGGCGAMTDWHYTEATDDEGAFVHFNLPFTIKAGCVERAIVSAGGPKLECDGHEGANSLSLKGDSDTQHEPVYRPPSEEVIEEALALYGTWTGDTPVYTPMDWGDQTKAFTTAAPTAA